MKLIIALGGALIGSGLLIALSQKTAAAVPDQSKSIDNPLTPVGNIMSAVKNSTEPRGIRNNNPLNIRWNALNNWDGQNGKDSGGFSIFDKPEMGIRAAAKILDSYRSRGITTLGRIVSTWAPAIENDVNAYVSHIEKALGKSRESTITKSDYVPLLAAMIKHENGKQPYSLELISRGVSIA